MTSIGHERVYRRYKKSKSGDISYQEYIELLDSVDYEYVDQSLLNAKYKSDIYDFNLYRELPNKDRYDDYNGYYIDDYGNPDYLKVENEVDTGIGISYGTTDPLGFISSNEFDYIVIGKGHSLYLCDDCKSLFMDKNGYYFDKRERSKMFAHGGDLCQKCFDETLLKERSKVLRQSIGEMMKSGSIATSKQQRYLHNIFKEN